MKQKACCFVLTFLILTVSLCGGTTVQVTAVGIQNNALTVSYQQPALLSGTFFVPEVSLSLTGSWSSSIELVTETLTATNGRSLSLVASDFAPVSTAKSQFMRVASIPATTTTPNYNSISNDVSTWLLTDSSLPDGAILYTPSEIEPYFGNLAASGLLLNSGDYTAVQNWIRWYIAHLNVTDQWNLGGTIYDYTVSGTTEISSGSADSTDAYAGTFLNLVWSYWQTGNTNAQTYIKTIGPKLNSVGHVITATQQSDGLTWALPNYEIKYLMDNCEAYQGLMAAANLFQSALNDTTDATYYRNAAANMLQGIQTKLWNPGGGDYYYYIDNAGTGYSPNWTIWYPDATAELYPIATGILSTTSTSATGLYSQFNANFPNWPLLLKPDPFPWAVIGYAAVLMNDSVRARTYVESCYQRYDVNQFPWPWYDAEAGWFMQMCHALSIADPVAAHGRNSGNSRPVHSR